MRHNPLALLRRTAALLATAVLCSGALVGQATAATANGAPSPVDDGSSSVRVPMTVVCQVDPSTVERGESLEQLCDEQAGVQPTGRVEGDCGWSELYLHNAGYGDARFTLGAHSTKGAIIRGSASIGWTNFSGGSGSFRAAVTVSENATTWKYQPVKHTGDGRVAADMSGDVLLTSGTICSFLNPSDVEYIS